MLQHSFEEAVRLLPDAFSVIDRDWRIVYVNDAVVETVRRSREDLIGRPLFEVFPEFEREDFVPHLEQAMRDSVQVTFDNYNAAWDRYFENHVVPFGDGIGVFFRDVTDRVLERKRLEESERRFAHVLESIGDGFVAIGPDWRYTYVNQKAGEMFGRSPEDLVGRSYREEFPEAIGTPFERAYSRVMETGEPEVLEDHYEPWDRWFENRVYPLAGGGIAIYFTEITERRHAERALRESEERLSRVVDTVPVGVAIVSTDGNITFANEEAERILGLHGSEIVGKTFDASTWEITAADGGPFPAEDLPAARVLNTGESVEGVVHAIVLPDGTRRILSVNAAPLLDEEGRVAGALTSFQDVSEQVRAGAALRESEARFRALVENSAELITCSDPDTLRMAYVSPSIERILGYAPEEFMALPETISTIHPDDREPLIASTVRVLSGEDHGPPQLIRMTHKDGSNVWAETTTSLATDHAGDRLLVRNTRDVTERILAEIELNENAERLAILHEMDAAIVASETVAEIASRAVEGLAKLIPHDGIGVGLWDIPSGSGTVISAGPGGRLGEWTIPLSDLPVEVREASRGSIIYARDLAEGPAGKSMDDLREAGMHSAIFASMWADEERSGDVWACSYALDAFLEKHGAIMREVADLLALAVRHARLREVAARRAEQAEREARRVEGLNKMGKAILAAATPEETAKVALTHLTQVVACVRASVVHYDLREQTATFIHAIERAPVGPKSGDKVPLAIMPSLELIGQDVWYVPRLGDLVERPPLLQQVHDNGISSFVATALRVDHEPLGGLFVMTTAPDAYSGEDLERVREVADVLSIALRQELSHRALSRQAARLEGLHELDRAILGSSSPSEMARLSLQHLGGLLDFDRASVWEMSEDDRALSFLAVVDLQGGAPHVGDSLPLDALGPAEGLLSQGAVRVDDLKAAGDRGPLVSAWVEAGFRSLAGVRLSADDRTLGGMFALSEKIDGFEKGDLDLLREVGAQLSIGMRKAQMEEDLAERAARLDELARERGRLLEGLVGAQEEERARVARELHDSLGQTLTSLGMLAADLERDARGAGVKEGLARFKSLLDDAVLETRHMVAGLRPVELESGLAPAVELLLAGTTEGTDIHPGLTDETKGKRYPNPIEATVFRVVQEAVTNAVRHSSPSGVSVVLAERRGRLSAIVEDDGTGFAPGEATSGYGLLGMRERAAIIRGELTVESSVGAGTTVRLEVPV